MISVCIATYNGSKYIKQQLDSILWQLGEDDEVIVVDDSSSDDTVYIINSLKDHRVKVIKNNHNKGVISTFSRSISLAKGDIIFLSDQDDIWLPNKVELIMSTFKRHPNSTLCLSDAQIINSNNRIIYDSYFKIRGGFSSGLVSNIVKNKYLGCTIAFKRSMNKYILPFPSNIPSHDMWIGLINTVYGNVTYVDFPLISYRRHSGNVSPSSHQQLWIMIKWRLIVIYRLLQRLLKYAN